MRAWRRLDDEDRLNFLAALWAARGYDTSVVSVDQTEGAGSAARDEAGGTRVVRAVRDGRQCWIRPSRQDRGPTWLVRRLPLPRTASSETVALIDRGGTDTAVGDRRRRVTGADLRNLLLYGIERASGDRLAGRYLDVPLTVSDDESPSVSASPEADPSNAGGTDADRTRRTAGVVAVATALVLATVVGAVAFGAEVPNGDSLDGDPASGTADPQPEGDASSPATGTVGAAAAPGTPPPDERGTPDSGELSWPTFVDDGNGDGADPGTGAGAAQYPPGVGPDGVRDLQTLLAAHRFVLEGASFRLELSATGESPATLLGEGAPVDGPAVGIRGDGGWETVNASVEVSNGTRAIERATGTWYPGAEIDPVSVEYVAYADRGTEWRRTTFGPDGQRVTSTDRASTLPAPDAAVAARTAEWLDPFSGALAEASVQRAGNGTVTIAATRADRTRAVPVVYGVSLVVTPEGFIRQGSMTINHNPGPSASRVGISFVYRDVGSTNVTVPTVLTQLPARQQATGANQTASLATARSVGSRPMAVERD